jgi:hypothetical protein
MGFAYGLQYVCPGLYEGQTSTWIAAVVMFGIIELIKGLHSTLSQLLVGSDSMET